jgi:hypothetical protein
MAWFATWIVSREDPIISKLDWARDSHSELQLRDVKQLLAGPIDMHYLRDWALRLGIEQQLVDAMP